jgi:hypothetical protein
MEVTPVTIFCLAKKYVTGGWCGKTADSGRIGQIEIRKVKISTRKTASENII